VVQANSDEDEDDDKDLLVGCKGFEAVICTCLLSLFKYRQPLVSVYWRRLLVMHVNFVICRSE